MHPFVVLLPRLLFPLCFIFALLGCDLTKAPHPAQTDPEKEFIRICREEYKLDIVTQTIGDTVLFYLPLRHDLLEMKANGEKAQKIQQQGQKKRKFSIHYLDGQLDNRS